MKIPLANCISPLYPVFMITRQMQGKLKALAKRYPVVTITGPRQSGKTTLCRMAFPKRAYATLENPQTREFALQDPVGFLAQYEKGAILDEIQRAPDLLSYIQGIVDSKRKNGLFILTGSQDFQLSATVSQSLAGRTALLRLLPFSLEETSRYIEHPTLDDLMVRGFYPRIYDQNLDPTEALGFYFETYVERDIRSITNVKDLSLFQKFTRLCAGRIGSILNLSNLGNEVGITHTTAKEWLTMLEASYIVFLLQPFFKNYNKRIVKSPKLYFYDVGLAAYLLGIHNARQMSRDPLRGNLFEGMVVSELVKSRWNRAEPSNLFYFRDSNGNEVDVVAETKRGLLPIEIKASQTISQDFFKGLAYFENIAKDPLAGKAVVYGGKEKQKRTAGAVIPYLACDSILSRTSNPLNKSKM